MGWIGSWLVVEERSSVYMFAEIAGVHVLRDCHEPKASIAPVLCGETSNLVQTATEAKAPHEVVVGIPYPLLPCQVVKQVLLQTSPNDSVDTLCIFLYSQPPASLFQVRACVLPIAAVHSLV